MTLNFNAYMPYLLITTKTNKPKRLCLKIFNVTEILIGKLFVDFFQSVSLLYRYRVNCKLMELNYTYHTINRKKAAKKYIDQVKRLMF